MALHIVEEADRCLNCKNPLCQKGCPVGTAIPLVIQLFRERRMDEAGAVLFQNNPMSAVCSLICNHGAQCEGHCVRGRKGTPIHFSAIENYISSTYLERARFEKPEPTGKRAAVIGGGPAGIVAAMRLAQMGVAVTIFDQNPRLGGVMRYGIPEYRLPKRVLDRYQEILETLGVRIRHNTAIGSSLTIPDLFRDGLGGTPAVAGQHDALFDPDLMQTPDDVACFRTQRVGDADHPGEHTADGEIETGILRRNFIEGFLILLPDPGSFVLKNKMVASDTASAVLS